MTNTNLALAIHGYDHGNNDNNGHADGKGPGRLPFIGPLHHRHNATNAILVKLVKRKVPILYFLSRSRPKASSRDQLLFEGFISAGLLFHRPTRSE